MEASTLTHASRAGLLGRRSPLLKLAGDEKLVAMIRAGHEHAFEALFQRYHSRLLAFCRHMLRSTEDAEDVLQEVFVKAHAAMLADERPINARPWLYRIARNRCLNHLRRPVPEGQDSMDIMIGEGGVTTADRVQSREDFRSLVADVGELPETQRTALLLREIDALSYEEIAQTMDTTVPAVKSLLVRARMSLAEASHSRQLTCGEVRLELAEAAEGLCKASGPVRHHVKRCDPCREFRGELRSHTKALAALAPLGPLALLHKLIITKLGGTSSAASGSAAGSGGVAGGTAVAGTGAAAGSGAAAAGAGGAVAGAGGAAAAASGGSAGLAGGAAAAGAGGIGGAIGAKAAATAATAALLTAGAVEVRQIYSADQPVDDERNRAGAAVSAPPERGGGGIVAGEPQVQLETSTATAIATPAAAGAPPSAAPPAPADEAPAPPAEPTTAPAEEAAPPPPIADQVEDGVVGPAAGGAGAGPGAGAGASDSGTGEGVVVIAEPTPVTPAPAPAPAPSDPVVTDPAPAPAPTPAPAPAPAPTLAPSESAPGS
ncbi:MAG: polymerase, sigma-24 subunit, subfamily [Geminicoccaceae bacterium]|nr:polymerase, sigma-24 subunit, subfamily [Geminicoccaceae bacterium]